MNRFILILGVTNLSSDLKLIKKLNPETVFVADSINYLTLKDKIKQSIVDIKLPPLLGNNNLYDVDIFKNDREKIENISSKIGYSFDNQISKALKFFSGYIFIELLKIKYIIENNQNSELHIFTSQEYKNLLDKILNNSNLIKYTIRRVSIKNFIYYLYKSRLISHYGRLSLFAYSIAFTSKKLFESFSLNKKQNFSENKKYCLVSDTKYCKQIYDNLNIKESIFNLDQLTTINLSYIFRNYFIVRKEVIKDIKNNYALKKIINLYPFLDFSIKNIYGPYLYLLSKKLKTIFERESICSIIQESDCAPHRHIITLNGKQKKIKTYVVYRHDIPEPLMITDVQSEIICTTSKSFYHYANANPISNHNRKKSILLNEVEDSVTMDKTKTICNLNNEIYILTNGYAGFSLRTNLIENFNLIKKTLFYAKKYNLEKKLIIKIHPSESINLYKNEFPNLKIEKNDITLVRNKINRAITTSTSALFKLGKDVMISYSSFGERPIQYPAKNVYSIEDIIENASIFKH